MVTVATPYIESDWNIKQVYCMDLAMIDADGSSVVFSIDIL